MNPSPTPIFLFSLPRSGSTLLQSLLASHSDITTTSESWLLLPLVYSLKEKGLCSEYIHTECYRAWKDLNDQLISRDYSLQQAIIDFVNSVYSRFSEDNTIYFLEKTPRNYLIADDIRNLFPASKFIVLYRNPLSIVSSMIDTFHEGSMTMSSDLIDLFKGPGLLVDFVKKNTDNIHVLNYEQLITDTTKELDKILGFLDLKKGSINSDRIIPVRGEMGDRKIAQSSYLYKSSLDSINKYKWNFVRKKFLKAFLSNCGENVIAQMGYEYGKLISSVDQLQSGLGKNISDTFNISMGYLKYQIKQYLIHRTQ